MDAGSNAYSDQLPLPVLDVPSIDDRMAMTAQKLETDFSKVVSKIHRFPRGLRAIGGDNNRYIVPSVVAIGPYHHGLPQLQKMEEVKLAAAHYMCTQSSCSGAQVYEKVLSIVGEARGCYDADDPSVEGVGDKDFADMMFLDGCFLLQYMVGVGGDASPVLQNRMMLSTGPSIQKDIFLLENQIPLLVLDTLAEFMPVDVPRFIEGMGQRFLPAKVRSSKKCWGRMTRTNRRSGGAMEMETHGPLVVFFRRPPHLLGRLRFSQLGLLPAHVKSYSGVSSSLTSSAVELAQMGIKLTARPEEGFAAMRVRRGLLFGELSLSPLFLNDVTACWFVNIVAEEASISGTTPGGFVVSSYLSVLAMLMDREEDVQQLREKRILYSTFTNSQTLGFFKRLVHYLPVDRFYFALLEDIEAYKRSRAVQIFVHRLLYNSFKAMTIATLFSIVGVLVGIFKTLLDSKNKGVAP